MIICEVKEFIQHNCNLVWLIPRCSKRKCTIKKIWFLDVLKENVQ